MDANGCKEKCRTNEDCAVAGLEYTAAGTGKCHLWPASVLAGYTGCSTYTGGLSTTIFARTALVQPTPGAARKRLS